MNAPETRAIHRIPWPRRLHPFTLLLAVLPLLAVCVLLRDWGRPTVLLLVALGVITAGQVAERPGSWPRRVAAAWMGAGLAVAVLSATLSFGVAAPGGRTLIHVGGFALTDTMWAVGLASALRIVALMAIALVSGLGADAGAVARALVHTLHVPYRVAYTAVAGVGMFAAMGRDMRTIQAAYRVRGFAGRGPLAAMSRYLQAVVALIAGAIRRAERTAIAMDARAFGAYPTRTERDVPHFQRADLLVMATGWLFALVLVAVGPDAARLIG